MEIQEKLQKTFDTCNEISNLSSQLGTHSKKGLGILKQVEDDEVSINAGQKQKFMDRGDALKTQLQDLVNSLPE